MAKRVKRKFDAEFKAGAVKLVREEDKTPAQVARDLDIVPSVLGAWIKRAEAEEAPGGGGALKAAERAELTSLRKENRILKMERDLLKKATAFFARENA